MNSKGRPAEQERYVNDVIPGSPTFSLVPLQQSVPLSPSDGITVSTLLCYMPTKVDTTKEASLTRFMHLFKGSWSYQRSIMDRNRAWSRVLVEHAER